jgi:hypothetical protein
MSFLSGSAAGMISPMEHRCQRMSFISSRERPDEHGTDDDKDLQGELIKCILLMQKVF